MTHDTAAACPNTEELLAYAHGDTTAAISEHIESCEVCSRSIAEVFSWLEDEETAPTAATAALPRALWEEIEERLRFRRKGGRVLHIGFSPFPAVRDEGVQREPLQVARAIGHRGEGSAVASALTLEDGTEIALSLRGTMLTVRASRGSRPLAGLCMEWAHALPRSARQERSSATAGGRTTVVTDAGGRARIRFPSSDPVRLWISSGTVE
jgi:hypothetical protein